MSLFYLETGNSVPATPWGKAEREGKSFQQVYMSKYFEYGKHM